MPRIDKLYLSLMWQELKQDSTFFLQMLITFYHSQIFYLRQFAKVMEFGLEYCILEMTLGLIRIWQDIPLCHDCDICVQVLLVAFDCICVILLLWKLNSFDNDTWAVEVRKFWQQYIRCPTCWVFIKRLFLLAKISKKFGKCVRLTVCLSVCLFWLRYRS